jgi:hypothetical protein
MTAEEIRAFVFSSDQSGDSSLLSMLREIAAQLADANEAQRVRAEKADALIAEAKAEAATKKVFLDDLIAELKPLIPRITQLFDPPIVETPALAHSAFADAPVAFIAVRTS